MGSPVCFWPTCGWYAGWRQKKGSKMAGLTPERKTHISPEECQLPRAKSPSCRPAPQTTPEGERLHAPSIVKHTHRVFNTPATCQIPPHTTCIPPAHLNPSAESLPCHPGCRRSPKRRGWEAATAGGACESGSARHRSGPWAPRRRSDRREACAKHEGAYLRLRRAPCLPCRHRKQRRDHQEDGSRHRGAQPEEKRNSRVSPSSRVVASCLSSQWHAGLMRGL